MKHLQVRNVPDRIHRELRARAGAAGVSLSEYALTELARAVERPRIADVLARAGSRAGGASREEIVAAVREGREHG